MYTFLEQFPPLPANVLELDDVSAYDVAEANVKLALDFSKNFAQDGKKVAILLPDEAEANIAIENQGGISEPHPGVIISSLRKSEEGDQRIFKVRSFGNKRKDRIRKTMRWPAAYSFCLCFSHYVRTTAGTGSSVFIW